MFYFIKVLFSLFFFFFFFFLSFDFFGDYYGKFYYNYFVYVFVVFNSYIILEKMVCIREDRYGGFSEYTTFELIPSYWYDMYELRNNPRWQYFWWKVEFRWQVIEALEKTWTFDLPDFTFFIKKLDELCVDLDPTKYSDSEIYIEKLVRMVKQRKINESTKDIKKCLHHQNHYIGE